MMAGCGRQTNEGDETVLSWFQSRKAATTTTVSNGAIADQTTHSDTISDIAILPTSNRLAYANAPADLPLVYKTVGQCLDDAATSFGHQDALVNLSEGARLTYAELQQRANKLARALIGYGLKKGDRVGLWSPNSSNWIILQLAPAKAGVILVTVNPAYGAQELGFVLNHSGARVLFSARSFRDRDFSDDFLVAKEAAPKLEAIFTLQGDSGSGFDNLTSFEQFSDKVSTDDLCARETALNPEDPINIRYTSRTTGQPKGATLTHHSIVNNAIFIGRHQKFSDNDRLCLPVPLFHCFGNVLGTLCATLYGVTIVMPGAAFDPKTTLEAIHQERCTALYAVPMMAIAILNHEDFANYDLTSLRTGVFGAAPCPAEVMKDVVAKMHMTELTICYGMTETSPSQHKPKLGMI